MMLKEGDRAPYFALPNQDGKTVRLDAFKGRWLLIYFYPRDDTPGCIKEACSVRDSATSFYEGGLAVVGISTDSVESHKKFSQKYGLNFDILADENKEAVNAYGVWGKKSFMGREFMGTYRSSFLINPEGIIAKVYQQVKPEAHVGEVLADNKTLQSGE